MSSGNGYDEYDENLDWDAWVDEAFQDYQNNQPGKGSSNNLPAKMPGTKKVSSKKKWQLPLDWNFPGSDKARKMREELEKLKEEKILHRSQDAKNIKWKTITKGDEYEIIVGGNSLGRIRQTLGGRWKIYPSFRWEDIYAKRIMVDGEYDCFHSAGHGLVDLWIIS